ncbi:MAG: hypothetical protein KAS71_00560, partial [Bacteroidales bacterium]|nr:hypothetical protein [Bacteroidales bacterium]
RAVAAPGVAVVTVHLPLVQEVAALLVGLLVAQDQQAAVAVQDLPVQEVEEDRYIIICCSSSEQLFLIELK